MKSPWVKSPRGGNLRPLDARDRTGRVGASGASARDSVHASGLSDRHAAFVSALALIAAAIERLATNVRHWQRTEVSEAEEAFSKGQKGSSAMLTNEIDIERKPLRLGARGSLHLTPALENVALWHERDISHSSVERMIMPDATTTLAFMLERTRRVVDGLVVYPQNLKANLDRSRGLWASEGIMLSLVEKGLARQQAYVLVQRNAMRAFAGEGLFSELLLSDAELTQYLSPRQISETLQSRPFTGENRHYY